MTALFIIAAILAVCVVLCASYISWKSVIELAVIIAWAAGVIAFAGGLT